MIENREIWSSNCCELFSRTCFAEKKFSDLEFKIYIFFFFISLAHSFATHSLPESLEPAEKIEHRIYDEAHATTDNCQKLYPKCIESVWNSKYI